MNITTVLDLTSEISKDRLAGLTQDLASDLSRAGCPTTTVRAESSDGARGDAFTVGQLALDLAASGAVTAFIECLKAYFLRDRTLRATLTRPDGTKVEIDAKNVDEASLQLAVMGLNNEKIRK